MNNKDSSLLNETIKKYHIEQFFTDIDACMYGMKMVSMKKNTYLYSRAEHMKYAFFLIDGRLQVLANMEDGQTMLLRDCSEFIFIGDMELLGYKNSANTIQLISDCRFLALDISLLKEQLLSDPVFLRFLCNNFAEKINSFSKQQLHNKVISNRQKVASHILRVAGKNGLFRENLRTTSTLLDISYRHLHRILSELVNEGILIRCDRGYQIAKIGKLEEYYWAHEK